MCLLLMCAGGALLAQVSARKEASDKLRQVVQQIKSDKPIHIHYSMYVQPRQLLLAVANPSFTQELHYYKAGSSVRIVMSDSVEILRSGYMGLMLDHKKKEMTVGRDTLGEEENPLDVIPMLADSAMEVKKLGEDEYQFLFHEEMIYKQMKVGFDEKTKQIKYFEVEMDDDASEVYKMMRISYLVWDSKWKPSKTFSDLSRYIKPKGAHFVSSSLFGHYNFIDTTLPQQAITY